MTSPVVNEALKLVSVFEFATFYKKGKIVDDIFWIILSINNLFVFLFFAITNFFFCSLKLENSAHLEYNLQPEGFSNLQNNVYHWVSAVKFKLKIFFLQTDFWDVRSQYIRNSLPVRHCRSSGKYRLKLGPSTHV